MEQFQYTARSESGEKKEGITAATDTAQAVGRLKEQGLIITKLEPIHRSTVVSQMNSWFENLQKISLTDRTIFTQNLYIMVKSGIPLAQSLGTLSQQTKNKHFSRMLLAMKQDIERGDTFAKTLGTYTKYFSEVYVSMVAAGETSGKLDAILDQLAKQLKKERALLGKVRGAMFYPAIVTGAMVLIGAGMMVFVIPKIAAIYKETDAQLPLPTRVLIGMSDFLVQRGVFVAAGLVVVYFIARRIFKTTSGKKVLHNMYLHTPILGAITKKIHIARFARTLNSLLQTDIPIVQSFQIIERTLGNVYYREAMEDAATSLKKGTSVVEALRKRPKLFPPLVTQMISVGEESGKLDELADDIATFYEDDVDETMSNFSAIIEPVLILILGIAVGAMSIAIILPIYTLTQHI